MIQILLSAALALGSSLDPMLDQLEPDLSEVRLSAQLVPSTLDLDVVWLPYDPGVKDGGHWIPPLRLGITEKRTEQWPAQQGTDSFHWIDRLERDYYVPNQGRFAHQSLPFEIALQVDAEGQALQVQISTTVISELDAKSPATTRVRNRSAAGQMLAGQSLVISNLYPFEEVLPILGRLPILGPLFQPSSSGPSVLLRAEPD